MHYNLFNAPSLEHWCFFQISSFRQSYNTYKLLFIILFLYEIIRNKFWNFPSVLLVFQNCHPRQISPIYFNIEFLSQFKRKQVFSPSIIQHKETHNSSSVRNCNALKLLIVAVISRFSFFQILVNFSSMNVQSTPFCLQRLL